MNKKEDKEESQDFIFDSKGLTTEEIKVLDEKFMRTIKYRLGMEDLIK